jgi:hypothetical protein
MVRVQSRPRHEGIQGSGGTAPLILTSALDKGRLFISQPYRFTKAKEATTEQAAGLAPVSFRTTGSTENSLFPSRNRTSDRPARY